MNAIMASHIIMKYLLALTALLLVPLHALQAKDETTSKPNVILIMTDDQGYGDLACHGNPDVKTPELDRLKNESVSLSNFHVDSYCTPTRSALMTGRYSHRVGGWGTVAGRNMLRDSEVTMAEVFRHNDYDPVLCQPQPSKQTKATCSSSSSTLTHLLPWPIFRSLPKKVSMTA
jgi:uncharacterized sulfatase